MYSDQKEWMMQIKFFLALGWALSPLAQAFEYGNVVSSVPVMAQQQYVDQPQIVQTPTSGSGAVGNQSRRCRRP
jgi:hypothetical protein